jgi:hypothetical protein
VSFPRRVADGIRAVTFDQEARHGYRARLAWLVRGSGALPAWSLEYRAGLTGQFKVSATRSHPDGQSLVSCPDGCGANAPLSHLYERRFIYHIDHTVVNTSTGATLMTKPNEQAFFIRESISWPFESILSHGLDIPNPAHAELGPLKPTTIFPTTRNYYHWLIEELPLVLRAMDTESNIAVMAYREGITDKHRFVADQLDITLVPSPKTLRLRHHVLPGRANDSWFIHPSDAERLRSFGTNFIRPQLVDSPWLYISRRNTSRSFTGEAELEGRLASRGFRIVMPDQLTWMEQIAIFQNAKVVVGPHGAGLSNLVFTHPGATLIELTNGNHYNRCFEWISHVSGHTYRAICPDDGTIATMKDLERGILELMPLS